ncbi:MAG: four helix bundle protein [Anaerolineae bacterium]|nr:four helix bundle protein [Anaerolineae bacterium]
MVGPEKIQERTFKFACRVVKLHQYLSKMDESAKILSKQLLRSGTSIGANLEEAEAGQSRADFVSKCVIALKEARETHYWLRLLGETNLVAVEKITPITQEAKEIVAILTTIVKNSRNNAAEI